MRISFRQIWLIAFNRLSIIKGRPTYVRTQPTQIFAVSFFDEAKTWDSDHWVCIKENLSSISHIKGLNKWTASKYKYESSFKTSIWGTLQVKLAGSFSQTMNTCWIVSKALEKLTRNISFWVYAHQAHIVTIHHLKRETFTTLRWRTNWNNDKGATKGETPLIDKSNHKNA